MLAGVGENDLRCGMAWFDGVTIVCIDVVLPKCQFVVTALADRSECVPVRMTIDVEVYAARHECNDWAQSSSHRR